MRRLRRSWVVVCLVLSSFFYNTSLADNTEAKKLFDKSFFFYADLFSTTRPSNLITAEEKFDSQAWTLWGEGFVGTLQHKPALLKEIPLLYFVSLFHGLIASGMLSDKIQLGLIALVRDNLDFFEQHPMKHIKQQVENIEQLTAVQTLPSHHLRTFLQRENDVISFMEIYLATLETGIALGLVKAAPQAHNRRKRVFAQHRLASRQRIAVAIVKFLSTASAVDKETLQGWLKTTMDPETGRFAYVGGVLKELAGF